MNRIAVTVSTGSIESEEKKILDKAGKFCKKILKVMNINDWEVSILFCNDEYIQQLNKQYRNIDKPTDVLSFSQEDGFPDVHHCIYAGDIVISLEMCRRNAALENISYNEELKRLLTHGILHLNGYDHELPEDYKRMITIQDSILERLSGETVI